MKPKSFMKFNQFSTPKKKKHNIDVQKMKNISIALRNVTWINTVNMKIRDARYFYLLYVNKCYLIFSLKVRIFHVMNAKNNMSSLTSMRKRKFQLNNDKKKKRNFNFNFF